MSQTVARSTSRAPGRAEIIARLRAHAGEICGHGIVDLAIFGSRARGDERPDSDLDVLAGYDPKRPFTLYDLVRVERLLEEITGLDVHVSTRDGLHPQQLDRVLSEAISVL